MGKSVLSRNELQRPTLGSVADNAATLYTFNTAVVRCLITRVTTAGTWKYRANSGANNASNTVFDGTLPVGTTDISLDGARAIKDVSIYFAGTGAAPASGEIMVAGLAS